MASAERMTLSLTANSSAETLTLLAVFTEKPAIAAMSSSLFGGMAFPVIAILRQHGAPRLCDRGQRVGSDFAPGARE
jgi:hypothetical protein